MTLSGGVALCRSSLLWGSLFASPFVYLCLLQRMAVCDLGWRHSNVQEAFCWSLEWIRCLCALVTLFAYTSLGSWCIRYVRIHWRFVQNAVYGIMERKLIQIQQADYAFSMGRGVTATRIYLPSLLTSSESHCSWIAVGYRSGNQFSLYTFANCYWVPFLWSMWCLLRLVWCSFLVRVPLGV